ncbi:hypothetical protein IY145_24200 [Methylosinus sp. H3A]|uniref:hypothetical protein n=1 Tax=Methylosinus sp. H3A TaxID=2785786 RepID=UPI0018C34874|nr:hypothetical protein [Methylosinus sp. H3A]MBG0812441.1 hypothetical protein [Methylosinus sp. H3A]
MNDSTLPLSGLSPVSGKTVVAKFYGGLLSFDGGVLLLLREMGLSGILCAGPGFHHAATKRSSNMMAN